MLRIGIDARLADWPGIGRYIRLLLTGLASRRDVQIVAYTGSRGSEHVPGGVDQRTLRSGPLSPFQHLELRRYIRTDRLDLFHSPHFTIPAWSPVPVVATVHDALPLRFPPSGLFGLARRAYTAALFALVARRAAAVITVSEFSKRDLVALTAIPADRITAIHNALDPALLRAADAVAVRRSNPPTTAPAILYVGTNKPWKNVDVALRGADAAARSIPGLRFIIAGKQAANQESIGSLLDRVSPTIAVEVRGEVTDAELLDLYGGALAVVCPSAYEGFGFVGLEAMATGAPVIHSNRAGLHEALGDAGLVADAHSVDQWAEAIVRIHGDKGVRTRLAAEGRARARAFSLDAMIAKTLAVYAAVGDSRSPA